MNEDPNCLMNGHGFDKNGVCIYCGAAPPNKPDNLLWGGPKEAEKVTRPKPVTTDCIIWTGGLTNDGYGYHNHKFVHRIAFEEAGGVLVKGMTIDHLCGNRACINPEHLEQVTYRQNILRGKTIAAGNAAKTHCPHGHEYNEANTVFYGSWRKCGVCYPNKRASNGESAKPRRRKTHE